MKTYSHFCGYLEGNSLNPYRNEIFVTNGGEKIKTHIAGPVNLTVFAIN